MNEPITTPIQKTAKWKFWLLLMVTVSFSVLCILVSMLIVFGWIDERSKSDEKIRKGIEIHIKRPPDMTIYSQIDIYLNGKERWAVEPKLKALSGDSLAYIVELDESIRPDSILSSKLLHFGRYGTRLELIYTETKTERKEYAIPYEYINDSTVIADRNMYMASCDSLQSKYTDIRAIMDRYYGERWKFKIQYNADVQRMIDDAKSQTNRTR